MSYNYIICAERNSGKTTTALDLIKKGIIQSGIISLSNKEKSEYYALNIESGSNKVLLSQNNGQMSLLSRFKIHEDTFIWANEYLSNIENGTVIIDEIGRLELKELGFAPALKTLLKKDVTLYITVRSSFLEQVINYFEIENYTILNGNSL